MKMLFNVSISRTKVSEKFIQILGFACRSGEIIPTTLFCDGIENCSDGSDEIMTSNGNKFSIE